MAHFVRHHPIKWDLVRGESFIDKRTRKTICEKQELVDKSRATTSGLWWTDQRYVDQVVPARYVHPDFFDTFNYRYQVYARPLVKIPPRSLAEACDHAVPVSYNVKRIAVDKVWVPGDTACSHHWSKQPWQLPCCPPIRQEKADDCNQNNNTPFTSQSPLTDNFVSIFLLQHQTVMNNKNKSQFSLLDVESLNNQNVLQHQGFGHTNKPHYPRDLNTPVSNHSVNKGQTSMSHSPRNFSSSAKKENNYNGHTVDSSKYGVVESLYNESSCKDSSIIKYKEIEHCCRKELADCGTEGVPNQSGTKVCLAARAVTNHSEGRINKDTLASLSCNQNNNGEVDLMNESYRMGTVDNQVGTDIEGISNCSEHPNTAFTISHSNHFQPDIYSQDGVITVLSQSDNLWCNYNLCRNNNAACGSVSDERPGCVPRQYCDYCCYTPCQLDTPRQNLRKQYKGPPPCMEMLGHLQSRVKPRCFISLTPKPNERRVSEVTLETAYEKKMSDMGYRTYKIIGSKQYCLPPPRDYLADIELPPHLDEYREFTRRCPNPRIGRYDRSDPANEMLLPGSIASNSIKVQRNPFMYLRNSKCNQYSPLFYTPMETGELVWSFPTAALNSQ